MIKKKKNQTKIPRRMKLAGLFLMGALSFASATETYGQMKNISIEVNNQSVQQVLDEIEAKSDFNFFYNNKQINTKRLVSVNVANKNVFTVLDQLFANTNIGYKVLDKSIILSVKEAKIAEVQQSERKVTGTVVDATGQSIIGANVIIKGTTLGTITDLDGNFSLNIPSDAVLVFTYIGYSEQEVKAEGATTFNIVMKEDSEILDEVVVVGFGTQKKINLTGSVGTVNAEKLEARPVVNATQALQGMVPGLQISNSGGSMQSEANISIRGIATIGEGSSGSPLILIDGMEGDINSINPQDIENISVLKDAAASSIYGSRAPFGVILITTKSGKNGKTIINYNNSLRWSDPVNMPDMMDSYTFATYFNDGNINAGKSPHFNDEALANIKGFQSGELKNSMVPDSNNPQYWYGTYKSTFDNVDWYDSLYRSNVFSQEHNLSISGGNEKINYYASMNYLDQNGLMEFNQDKYKRYTATGKINVVLSKWAKLQYSSRFSREDNTSPTYMNDDLFSNLARQGWPTLPLYDPNGYLYSIPSPALGLAEGGNKKYETDNIYQQANLTLNPIENWVTHIDFNYRVKSQNKHVDQKELYNHDVNGEPFVYNKNSYVQEANEKQNYLNFNAYTEYSLKVNEDHNFKALLGFQAEKMDYKYFDLQRVGIISNDNPFVDLTTGYDYNGNLVTPVVSGSAKTWSTAGFFGRVNYNYKGRYLAEVNMRYDGTSRYRKDQRWNWFPSVSLGWNVAREGFWKPLENYVGTLKLRGSYGELGNQNTDSWYPTYQTISVLAASGTWLQNNMKTNIAKTPELISTNMGWERVKNWNLGLDFGALNNRLTGSIDYYNRLTKDMIGPAPELPATLGADVPKMNNTNLKTYGFDFEIAWNDRLANGLGYNLKFILSDSQTEITDYPNPTNTLSEYRQGQKIGEIWGYQTVGIAQSKEEMDTYLASLPNGGQNALGTKWDAGDVMYKDLNGDGKIDNGSNTLEDHGDLKVIGNNTPRYQFGIDLSADYKGFDIRAFFQGVLKRDYWQDSEYFWGATDNMWWSTGFTEHMDYFRATASNDLPANLNSFYPRPIFGTDKNQQAQTRYLLDASYIRLKNLQLGYSLPNKIIDKINITKMRVFVSGENLWTGTGIASMFDPETVSGGKIGNEEGNGNAYPLSKVLSVGVNVTF